MASEITDRRLQMIKKTTVGVFIDLKKAFDNIEHNLVLQKFEHYGIRSIDYDWVKSCLYNRKQYVQINYMNQI